MMRDFARNVGLFAVACLAGALMAGCAVHTPAKYVIAHRGASGYLPEHTLPAYALAAGQGADIIEPDVVLTRDGVLICSHDLTLDAATNVEEVYAGKGRARDDGKHYAIDFTLAEIRGLMVDDKERYTAPADQRNGYHVATLDEMLAMVERLAERLGRPIGVIPEPKSPGFHAGEGQPIEQALVDAMKARGFLNGLRGKGGRLGIIQCFDLESVEWFAALGVAKEDLVWLVTSQQPTASEMERAERVVHGLGPSRKLLEGPDGKAFLKDVHERGLVLYPYTFRDELGATRAILALPAVAGVFTDFPDVAIEARGSLD